MLGFNYIFSLRINKSGIIQRADYLAQLGIDAIWLNPIYKSPDKDFGYDINNFEDIQPLFGTLDDFKKLVEVLDGKGTYALIFEFLTIFPK